MTTNSVSRLVGAGLLALAASGSTWAQAAPWPPVPENVVQLSASSSVEVQQDLIAITLGTTRDGTDAAGVQAQLKAALDAALTEARRSAQPGQLEVRTGNFNLRPRYAKDGKINGWVGTTELVLEGRDIARIGTVAGKIQTLTLSGVAFNLSREQRSKVEAEAQAAAIAQFRAKAGEVSKQFGFGGYTLREVSLNATDPVSPHPKFMVMAARSEAADAPVPAEAGKSTVTVTVSGSVQLK